MRISGTGLCSLLSKDYPTMAKISLFELTKMLNQDNQRISTSEDLFRQIAEHCSCTGFTVETWGEVCIRDRQ